MGLEDNNKMIWDKLAKKYDTLWVQNYSLTPTRNMVLQYIEYYRIKQSNFLDVGCGTGQLLLDISKKYPHDPTFGCDKSDEMIRFITSKRRRTRNFCSLMCQRIG